MMRHEDTEAPAREVSLWLDRSKTPYERYKNLPSHNKVVLGNQVCIPTRPTSPTERKDLYKALCLPDVGRDINPDEFVPSDEELRKFFTPVPPSEALAHYEKY